MHEKIQNAKIMLLKDDKKLRDALPMTRGGEPLLKSRSLIHVVERKNELLRVERGNNEEKKEKKASFWLKFLGGGLRREEKGEKSWSLRHSRTLKENTSAKWVPFF